MDPVKIWLDGYESASKLAQECEAEAARETRQDRKAYLEGEVSSHWDRAAFYWREAMQIQAHLASKTSRASVPTNISELIQ